MLRRIANANSIEIDEITGGKKDLDLYGQDIRGYDVLVSVDRDKSGAVNKISYLNSGADPYGTYDNLFISVDVNDAKKFAKDIGSSFNTFMVTPENIDSAAFFIDSFRGVSPGQHSTYVAIGDFNYSFA